MNEQNRIEYGDALVQGEAYVSEGMRPEDASRKVFSEWHVSEDAITRFASEGLTLALKGERETIPA